MKLNIMTWNAGITESQNDKNKCNQILDYLWFFLQKEESIVFLQQMIYKDPKNNWNEHQVYNELSSRFAEEYDIKYKHESTFMMTVVIAKKGTIKPLGEEFYPIDTPRNREIAVEFNGISFLAIHAENGDKNKNYLNALHGKADVILGDFNAGNYLKSENRYIFKCILKEHICILNMPTKEIRDKKNKLIRKSCIDHVFVRERDVTQCSNLVVHEDIKLSDHYPITFEMDLELTSKASN